MAARQLGRRFVGIDISPSSCNVMGQRLEQVCGMRQAPPSMGTEEIAGSWDRGISRGADGPVRDSSRLTKKMADTAVHPTGEKMAGTAAHPTKAGRIADPATTAYYRFANLPRSAEQLRKLPGFEFENWAVLQLGEVLKHQGHSIFAQTNRSKVGDMGLDGKIYLADKVSLPRKTGESLFGEHQTYLPIQVKNTDQVGRGEIDKFAHVLASREKRPVGFFIGWDFSGGAKGAYEEIKRLQRHADPEQRVYVIPVRVQELIAETFDTELLALAGR